MRPSKPGISPRCVPSSYDFRFIGPMLFSLCLVSTPGSAQTPPDCEAMKSLISQAHQNFVPAGADQCASAVGEGGTNIYFCSWSFPFRSGEARQLFTALNEQIGSCLNIGPATASDKPVNHPDSFWLNTFRLKKSELSISVKDKSNLDKSLLFLRVQSLPNSE